MNSFLSLTGIITQIQPNIGNDNSSYGCVLTVTLNTCNQGTVFFHMSGDTYVLDNTPFQKGDCVTFFYDALAPVPLIYPPQFRAVVAVKSNPCQYFLGTFSDDLVSSDQSICLDSNMQLPLYLPNGQPFCGSVAGKILLVEYTSSTKSIPALVCPNRIIVFCYN